MTACNDCWDEAFRRAQIGDGHQAEHYERIRQLPPQERPWCATSVTVVEAGLLADEPSVLEVADAERRMTEDVWCPGQPPEQETTSGRVLDQCPVELEHGPHQRGVRAMEAAFEDNDLPGMWSRADFDGGDPDERSYAQREADRAQQPERSGHVPGVDPYDLAGSA